MKELKCPKCGTTFTVDEADYATIVKQVRDAEFDAEVSRRLKEQKALSDAQQQLAKAEADKKLQSELSKKENEINSLQASIADLNNNLATIAKDKDAEKTSELAQKDQEITTLKSKLAQKDQEATIKVMEAENKSKDEINEKEKEIATLKSTIQQEQLQATQKEQALKEAHRVEVMDLRTQLDYFKDLKTKMTTKMVGESLEEHCSIEYEKNLRPYLLESEFGKDNDIVEGTKGDFVFRDFHNGIEITSIMFEMKNECNTDGKKHKNEEFLKKLDENRRKKKCKYAVLVSMLDPENELYNQGIVDKSFLYEDMYVIRPQFFVPFISFVVKNERKNIGLLEEIEDIKRREFDVCKFQDALKVGKDLFASHCQHAINNHDNAIKQIDDVIKTLQETKKLLETSNKQLGFAEKSLEGLSVDKLTKDNPTMKLKFAEAAASQKTEIISQEPASGNPE